MWLPIDAKFPIEDYQRLIDAQENADPDVCADMLDWLDEAVPQSRPFRHAEGNSPAHIKATLVGQSATLPVENGRLALGTWQQLVLIDFDPRPRRREMPTVKN